MHDGGASGGGGGTGYYDTGHGRALQLPPTVALSVEVLPGTGGRSRQVRLPPFVASTAAAGGDGGNDDDPPSPIHHVGIDGGDTSNGAQHGGNPGGSAGVGAGAAGPSG